MTQNGKVLEYKYDGVEVRSATGAVQNSYKYDIWGKTLQATETVPNPVRLGELWDSSAALQYLRARWYDPSLGRFISEDTYEGELSNPLSQNLYTYVHNNPLIYIDPTGNYCVSADGNWAHEGQCNSSSSIYMGDDWNNPNAPIIENGKFAGMLGVMGSPHFLSNPTGNINYWQVVAEIAQRQARAQASQ